MLAFSIIVPVYNRPQEIEEFLMGLNSQSDKNFEVIILEAPSKNSCKHICEKYDKYFSVRYICDNSGRSTRRNMGMKIAKGNYFLLFDSDCILPSDYIKTIRHILSTEYTDCYGGPDNAGKDFSILQRAVNYSMTSFMTTGGIRGNTKNTDNFLPRAFNMGFSKEVFLKTKGYYEIIGEDVDLSMRIKEAGFKIKLIKEAFVYHKRRLNLHKFYKQVNTFGKARILLSKLHPNSAKLIHLFPSLFTIGNISLILVSIVFLNLWVLLPIFAYILAIFIESLIKNKNIRVAVLAIITSYIQLFGYGIGFINELITHKASKKIAESLYRQ